jgi:hypothetical protein
MATTTNYSWTTPDDTALVKDGAAAIRSLGTSVDTTTKALNPSTTLGDIEYRSSTANTNTRLGIGSTGNVLTVTGGVPTWATPAAGGGWTLIASGSVGTGSTFTISSIPQTYKNIRIQLLDWSASGDGDLVWKINNTTADTYYRITSSNGGSNITGTGGSGIRLSSGSVVGTYTSNMGVLDVLDYTNTSAFKVIRANALTQNNPATPYLEAWNGGGAYAADTAVTSLVFDPESSNTFDSGTYYLWGEN